MKRGDTKRKLWALTAAGKPIDLTGVTEVRMLAGLAPGQAVDAGASSLSAVCTVEGAATAGVVKEAVGGTGALGPALFLVEFQITRPDGTETVPEEDWFLLEVVRDLGP